MVEAHPHPELRRPLPPAPCRKCGYQMEGLTIDSSLPGVAQWRAVCPECGMDNFGPLKPERRTRWVMWFVSVLVGLGIAACVVLSWVVARALWPYLR